MRAATHCVLMKHLTPDQYKDVSERCAAFRVRKAARVVTRVYDEALRPIDLKITQFTLLISIQMGEPESITELAEILGMERTTLTRNLSVLERAGLIDVREEGGRARHMVVTEKGLEKLALAHPLWEEAQGRVETSMGDTTWSDAKAAFSALGSLA